MKRKITFLIAAMLLLTMITQPTRVWGQSDVYNSNVSFPSVSSPLSSCTVNIGTNGYSGIKMGTNSNKTGSFSITVPAGTRKLHVHAVGWTGKSSTLSVTTQSQGVKIKPSTAWSLTSDTGATGNSPFTINTTNNTTTSYYKEYTLSGVSSSTTITIANGNERAIVWGINAIKGHTITYSASNGSISGAVYGTQTPVISTDTIAEGEKVTLTATPASGYQFLAWSDGGNNSTLSSTSTNPTTFTMGTSNVTITATFVEAGNYITVAPSSPETVSSNGDNLEFTITTNINNPSYGIKYYDANEDEISKPDVFGTVSFNENTLSVQVNENEGAARAYGFKVYSGETYSTMVTISQAAFNVATPVLSVETGTYNENQSVTITCATNNAAIYYTIDNTPPTSNSILYDGAVSITQTTTLRAIAIKNAVSSEEASATYTMQCATPTFSPGAGTYDEVEVAITSTAGASIYYTLTGSTPTTYSTLYDGPITIAETKTLKARAFKDGWTQSDVASGTYTIVNPLTTIPAIFSAATNSSQSVVIIFNDWVVSGVSTTGKSVYVTDGTNGFEIYNYSAGLGFTAGDVLSGKASCTLQLNNGHARVTNLTSDNVTVTPGGSIIPAEIEISQLTGQNSGALLSYDELAYSKSSSDHYFSYTTSDQKKLKAYGDIFALNNFTFTTGKKYHVKGVYLLYNSTPEIMPRSTADIVLAAQMTPPTFSAFTYVATAGGPSATQSKSISGTDFLGDLTVTAPTHYEVSSDGTNWGATAAYTPNNSNAISGTLYVRMKAGLSAGTYNEDLKFEAANLTTKTQALEGEVDAQQKYSVTLNQIAGVTIAADVTLAYAETTVTLSYTDLDDCYTFSGWTVLDANSDPVDVENNQFELPDSNVEVEAVITQKIYTVHYSISGAVEDILDDIVNCGNNATLYTASDLDGVVDLPTGFKLLGWSDTEGSTETISSFVPTEESTLYAVLVDSEAVVGYELITSASQITAGKYLFAALRASTLPDPVKYYIANGTISSGMMQVTSDKYQPTDNIFDNIPTNGVEFTLTGDNTDGFVISYNSKSLGYTSAAANKLAFGNYNYLWKFYDHTSGLSTGALYMQNYRESTYYTVSENSTGTEPIRGYTGQNTIYRGFYLFKKHENSSFSNITEVTIEQTISTDIEEYSCVIVGDGAVLTFTGNNSGNSNNLIIEDGGQLILPDNATVAATLKKNTSASTGETKDAAVNKWYAISTPVSGVAISSFVPTAVGAKWNVYRYDEPTGYWNEYRSDNTVEPYLEPFITLESGRGYLYRATENNLAFAGNVNAGDENGEVKYDLSYAYAGSNTDFKGFNLLGNPFTHEITWSNLVTTNVEDDGYYLLIEEEGVNQGKWSANPLKTAIAPMQAFLVQANNTGAKVTIKNHASSKGEMKGYNNDIMFAVKNGEQSDEAYVLFKDGKGLNKVNHRNAEIPMLYVVNNGEKFAIADMNTDTKVINLGFEAKYIAKYTLSLKANGNFSYLHLIDKLTGEDVDMLLEGEYSFMASPTDNPERFIVRLEYSEGSESSEVFAYQNGSDIIVSGEGELQVFDVMGRLVIQKHVNGVERIHAEAQGVYIFKLNDKAQKIVIR